MKRSPVRLAGAVVALAAVAGSGCFGMYPGAYGPGPAVGPGPAGPGGPGGPGAPMMMGPQLGFGLSPSFGVLAASDEALESGSYFGVGFSMWLSSRLAIEFDVGAAIMEDTYYGGDLAVIPVTASAIFSFPLNPMSPAIRLRVGAGAGAAVLAHSEDDSGDGIDPIGIARFQVGSEMALPGSNSRLFGVFDIFSGEIARYTGGMAWWDLETMVAFRFGVVLSF